MTAFLLMVARKWAPEQPIFGISARTLWYVCAFGHMVLQRHSVVSRFKISLFEARFHADKMASEETQKKKRRTGGMCSLSFCSKRLKDNDSIHKSPKDPEIRKKWWKTRENVSKLNTVYVCSNHFTEGDYPINPS